MQSGPLQLQEWANRRFPTYTEAAKYLGINKSTMTKLANGTRRAGLKIAHHLERLTGIPAEAWLSEQVGTVGTTTRRNGRKSK